MRQCPILSHMLFSDDTLLFSKASKMEANKFLAILNQYGAASG